MQAAVLAARDASLAHPLRTDSRTMAVPSSWHRQATPSSARSLPVRSDLAGVREVAPRPAPAEGGLFRQGTPASTVRCEQNNTFDFLSPFWRQAPFLQAARLLLSPHIRAQKQKLLDRRRGAPGCSRIADFL